jgi:hypothetical protein
MQSTGKATPEAAASDAAEPGTPGLASADFADVSRFLDFFFFNVRSFGEDIPNINAPATSFYFPLSS